MSSRLRSYLDAARQGWREGRSEDGPLLPWLLLLLACAAGYLAGAWVGDHRASVAEDREEVPHAE